jgi:hypothetical protein
MLARASFVVGEDMHQQEKPSAFEQLTKNVIARIGTVVTGIAAVATALHQLTHDIVLTAEGLVLVMAIISCAFVVLWRLTKVEEDKKVHVPFFPKAQRLIAGAVLVVAIVLVVPYVWQVSNIVIQREQQEKELAAIPFLTLTPHPTSTQVPGAKQTATAVARSAWSLIFSDAFTLDRGNWRVVSTAAGTIARTIANGKYRVEMKASDVAEGSSHLATMRGVGTFYATVDAQRVTGPSSVGYGLLFRSEELGNYYEFLVSDDQVVLVRAFTDTKPIVLARVDQVSAIKPGAVNRLAIVAQGAHFELFINDQLITTLDDTKYKEGSVGLRVFSLKLTEDAVLEFSNFQVRAP